MAEVQVSAIIVNWNHGDFLPDCLDAILADGGSLAAQGHLLEVLVIDNASTDGSPEWLATRYQTGEYPNLRCFRFAGNQGFARALNHGIQSSRGAFVLSLNPDVVVQAGFLSALLSALPEDAGERVGMAAPKLLRADDPAFLDSTGLYVDRRRRPYDRGQGERDFGQYDAQTGVFGPCGAAALYRREMLEDLLLDGEYFDEAFFAYCEDADLAWRAQLRGWSCTYVPTAVATHVRGWGDTLRKQGHAPKNGSERGRGPRLALRNRYLMTLKNDACRYTFLDLPLITASELPRLAYAALTSPQVLLALFDLARAAPGALRKRNQIRSHARVADAALRHWFAAPSEPISVRPAENTPGC
jgi:GT2 family glycosyltransferase